MNLLFNQSTVFSSHSEDGHQINVFRRFARR